MVKAVILTGNRRATGAHGTAIQKSSSGSWISTFKANTDYRGGKIKCAVYNCGDDGVHGAHTFISGRAKTNHFIIPQCAAHNSHWLNGTPQPLKGKVVAIRVKIE